MRLVTGNLAWLLFAVIIQLICIPIDRVVPFDLGRLDKSHYFGKLHSYLTYREDHGMTVLMRFMGLNSVADIFENYEQNQFNDSTASYYNYTRHFSLGQLIFYICQIILGFIFVNYITLRNNRRDVFLGFAEEYSIYNPFNFALSRYHDNTTEKQWNFDRRYRDFWRCLFTTTATFIFSVSGTGVLRHINSVNAFCQEADGYGWATESRITQQELDQLRANNCQLSNRDVFMHNLVWIIGFQIGLNFTQFDLLPIMHSFKLTAEAVSTWPWYFFVILTSVLCYGVYVASLSIELIMFSGDHVVTIYQIWIITALCVGAFLTYLFPSGTHFHHWSLAFMLSTLLGHFSGVIVYHHGVLIGIIVEGATRYGLDPVWEF